MSDALRLILFDVDGTLVDSQGDIVASMTSAFASEGMAVPKRDAILGIVGLSLDVAIPKLVPGLDAAVYARLVDAYKAAYMALRGAQGSQISSPLYPHIRAVLDQLSAVDHYLLGVATGKSRRGLDALLAGHGMEHLFLTQQVADHHPSKPHPAMILAALSETGVAAQNAVMIGDTSFDMDMARAAGVRALAVGWGYHRAEDLVGRADDVIYDARALPGAIERIWESKQ
ncbi:Phosphoglycolate phosphatase [Thalassovita gelatinovora]|uniref:Phosphoglycolate phosphatase n=1 Tax=Thalassovita gelatinovora TaxID=53501 RepID=A0A0P1FGG6_THAGE|nr:HAD-IA family hydrolase [Thalassovita gelatinovora]QIZ81799.1 HAD-IA family hydrolase [Thalassovita gelatinovora]CUH67067.1 Phosphoglycolate phosphatase [Thalassovita gelatinovora]SEP81218.1 phosphoglycolate phosphatase [Thalassovita gelatinovora]